MRPPSHRDGRQDHGINQAAADHLVPCILSDWPGKNEYFAVATMPLVGRGVQYGLDAPQQDSPRDERTG